MSDTKQEAPAANELPQLVVCGNKLAPVPVIPNVRLIAVEPVLFKTTAWAVVVLPATMVPKLIAGPAGGIVPACRPIVPADAEAVADRFTDAGLPAALLATFSVPVKVPAEDELKVTITVQLAPMASGVVVLQVPPVTVKSAELVPAVVMPLIFTP